MTDFGRSAKGPTLTDISSVASNASNITTVAGSMQDVQDVAAEINATPTLRSLMNSVLNDTISLSGLTDTTIGTLGNSEQGYALTWVWDVNTSTGDWQAQPGSSITVNGAVTDGYGLKWDNVNGYYEQANFLEISNNSQTINTSQISDIQTPTGPNQLAYTNNSSQVVFANTNIPGTYSFAGDITIGGNLNVTGTTTTINTTSLEVADKSITLSNSATPSETSANGSGIDVDVTNMGALWTTDAPRIEYSSANTGLDQYWNLNRGIVAKGWSDAGSNVYDGQITLNCSANTHGITIKSAPHADNATYDLILPANAPAAGQVLAQNSANNQLEFVDLPSSGASTGFAIAMAIVF